MREDILELFLKKLITNKSTKEDVINGFVYHEWQEIKESRNDFFSEISDILHSNKLDFDALSNLILDNKKNTVITGSIGMRVKIKDFTKSIDSKNWLLGLIGNLDNPPSEAKVTEYVNKLSHIAFKDKNNEPTLADAGLFTSVILTACFPKTFVDFRQKHWKWLANVFELPPLKKNANYGEKLYWGGLVAKEFLNNSVYQNYFIDVKIEPYWFVSGLKHLLMKCPDYTTHLNEVFKNLKPSLYKDSDLLFKEKIKPIIVSFLNDEEMVISYDMIIKKLNTDLEKYEIKEQLRSL